MKHPSNSNLKPSAKIFLAVLGVGLAGTALWLLWPRATAPVAPLAKTTAPVAPTPSTDPEKFVAEIETAAASAPARPVAPPVVMTAPPVAMANSTPEFSAPAKTVPAARPAPMAAPGPENPEEIAATARMYAAHAPLRTPEVSDPDSKSNKQILQTMVLKALSQPAVNPPSSSLTNPAALSLSNGPSLPPSASAQP